MGCTPHSLVQSWESSSDVLQINQHLILNMADGLVEGESRMKIICIKLREKMQWNCRLFARSHFEFQVPSCFFRTTRSLVAHGM